MFSSIDKIISVLIHLLPGSQLGSDILWLMHFFQSQARFTTRPSSGNKTDINVYFFLGLNTGTVFFIIRWWDPITFAHHAVDDTGPWPAWPLLENDRQLWTWLFVVPLIAYSVWQILYLLVVNVLRHQRLLKDPEVMTSFRSLSDL